MPTGTGGINIPVEFPGAQNAAPELQAISRALAEMSAAEERVTQTARELGVTETQARQAMARAQQEATAAQQAGDRAMASAQQQSIQLAHHMSGAAMAVQALTSMLGGESRTAGLIGASINTATQFAQLGSILGPEGAVAGGIIGALIPALQALVQVQDEAAESAARLQQQQTRLAEITRSISASRRDQVQRELDSGHAETLSLTEVHDQRLIAEADASDLGRLVGSLGERQTLDASRGLQNTQAYHARADALHEYADQILAVTNRLGILGTREASLEASTGRATVGGVAGPPATAPATPPHSGRGGRTTGPTEAPIRIGSQSTTSRQGLDEDLTLAHSADSGRAQVAQQVATMEHAAAEQAHTDALQAKHDALALIELQQHKMEQNTREAEQAHQMATQQRERDRALSEQMRQQNAQQAQSYQSVTQGVVNNIVEAGNAIASGQATATHAFEKMLAGFLNMISQRAAIEAAAEYAGAIASFAREDYSGGAQHAAAGIAWTAVAVAAGAGGAALSAATQGGSAAAAPARPADSHTSGAHSGGTTVINFNSPIVTAGTEAQLGRKINQMQVRSAAIYPGG